MLSYFPVLDQAALEQERTSTRIRSNANGDRGSNGFHKNKKIKILTCGGLFLLYEGNSERVTNVWNATRRDLAVGALHCVVTFVFPSGDIFIPNHGRRVASFSQSGSRKYLRFER